MPLPYNQNHKERARLLRNDLTASEQALWKRLRRKQILGVQFYRQKPIGQYVADFYCPKAALVIEVDGGQHLAPDHAERDRLRDEEMAVLGLTVLRFSNQAVELHLDLVVEQVRTTVQRHLAREHH